MFSLRQALKMYDAIQQRIAEYEQEILRKLAAMQRDGLGQGPAPKVKNPQKAKAIKKRGEEPMREALYRMSGVDLTAIDALGVETVQVVLSEYGPDLSRFPSEKEFVSHVNAGAAQTDERRQAGQEEKAEHGEHARGRCVTNGSALVATVGRLWGPTTAKSHGALEEMSRCSRRPGSWPP